MRIDDSDDDQIPEVDLDRLDDASVQEAIQSTFPAAYRALPDRDRSRLTATIRYYIARRSELFSPRRESRRTTRIAAKKYVAEDRDFDVQVIDNALQTLYDDGRRAPNDWFETHLGLAFIAYQHSTLDSITTVDKWLFRLQNALLDIAALDPQPLDPADVTVDDVHTPRPYRRPPDDWIPDDNSLSEEEEASLCSRAPAGWESHDDYERHLKAEYERLLAAGKDAMDASDYSFHINDVTATDTAFGRIWQTTKTIVNEHFTLSPEKPHVDNIYASNDHDNVRFHADGPARNSDRVLVSLEVEYYPTGLMQVTSECFAIIGGESSHRRWYVPEHDLGHTFALTPPQIRSYIHHLRQFHSHSEAHVQTTSCPTDSGAPWLRRQ